MRWQLTIPPKIGERRVRRKFALLPVRMTEDRLVVWLEWYDVVEVWDYGYRHGYPIFLRCWNVVERSAHPVTQT
jgi:hypothetical protein